MKNLWKYVTRFYTQTILLPTVAACFLPAAIADSEIHGLAHNQTLGRASPGDEVILLRLDQSAQEEAHAITDVRGAFRFKVQHAGQSYLVRVVHQNVAYDRRASAGDTLFIEVFDAAPEVRGITGTIEILRAGTTGNLLHVSDMIEVTNESRPPLTLAGERTFEVYLPAIAKIDSVLAAGPEKTGVMIPATAISGEPGHYTVNFPLRPGATRFAFNYDLPYTGHSTFQPMLVYPLQQLAVMLPLTMKFASSASSFQILATGDPNYQVHAATRLKKGQGPWFEVSGVGALPLLNAQVKPLVPGQSRAVAGPPVSVPHLANLRAATAVTSPLPQKQPFSQELVLAVLCAALFAASGLLVWRARRSQRISRAKNMSAAMPWHT